MQVIFFGTHTIAVPSLKAMHAAEWQVALVVTAPDQPTGRTQVMTASPVKTTAIELGIPVRTPTTLKDEGFFSEFAAQKPDLCVVVAYGKIISQRYLDLPRLGFVNMHPSLLPAYRGPSPIQSAILDGCASTGVSIMLLDAEVDHGPVLAQEPWGIPPDATTAVCTRALGDLGARLLCETLTTYTTGSITPQPQDHTLATFTKKFIREDGRLDWNQPATAIHNRIRALSANPGIWTTWQGKTLNILRAHLKLERIVLDDVQLEGGKSMSWDDFCRGHPGTLKTVEK